MKTIIESVLSVPQAGPRRAIRVYTLCTFGIWLLLGACQSVGDNAEVAKAKPRIIISTDIGGTDPDDFQSMLHYLMYADQFQTEGLISSPYGEGRAADIIRMIDVYAQDFPTLKQQADFPVPDDLRQLVKQGAEDMAPAAGWSIATEGSDWIIRQAKLDDKQPLWVLVWGGLEDLAQALHDAPDIQDKIRVYWIGGPNKKWSVHAYLYIAQHFPDLWMIEANSTYRGWFIEDEIPAELGNQAFYELNVKESGAIGQEFGKHYGGQLKMGDTPSLAFLIDGNPDRPDGASWGGSFTPLDFSPYRIYHNHTDERDTVPAYAVVEWTFTDPAWQEDSGTESIWIEIDGQRIDGFYKGSGIYNIRFVPKRADQWAYEVHCTTPHLDGTTGGFVSTVPWPGQEKAGDLEVNRWWSDRTESDTYLDQYQGAKTVAQWRTAYLVDWAKRLQWLK